MIIRKLLLALFAVCFSINYAYADGEVGKVVFDCYYVNFAWGYQLSGIYIDSDGQIYKYNRNENPWLPESVRKGSQAHPESELMEKYLNVELVGRIDKKILDEKIKLIKPASRGTISKKQAGNDAGERGCVAYSYDKTEHSYKEIELGSKGDFNVVNSAPEAQELNRWLQDYWKLERRK